MSVINENLLTSKVSWAELQKTATGPGLHCSSVAVCHHGKSSLIIIPINKDRNWRPERPGNLPRVTQPVSDRTWVWTPALGSYIVCPIMWQPLCRPQRYKGDSLVVPLRLVEHMSMNKLVPLVHRQVIQVRFCANLIWFLHNQRNWTLLFPLRGYGNRLPRPDAAQQ